METEGLNLYITTVLYHVAQFLMIPVMIILIGLLLYAIFCITSLITEYFTERRYFKANAPKIINDIHNARFADVETIIKQSALLKPQKRALLMATRNMGLSADDLFALAKTELANVDDRYRGIVSRTEQVTKIAPMMGVMCTLIPLGPGIVAMGQGQVDILASSLGVAFDGTVAGLVAAVVAILVTAVRKRWYSKYMLILESLMTCVLDKAEQARSMEIVLPHNYYFDTDKKLTKPSASLADTTLVGATGFTEVPGRVESGVSPSFSAAPLPPPTLPQSEA
jgi:biopolymer transport protein ExbB/TolQ